MNGKEYQQYAMRTNDKEGMTRLCRKIFTASLETKTNVVDLITACFGLCGEVGEFVDLVKKWIFHEKDIDFHHLQLELGDILWYVALACDAMGWNMDEIMQMNIDKLSRRYKDGFTVEEANNRKQGDV